MLFTHHLKYYSVLQVGMDMALSLPEDCGVLLGTPGVSLDQFSLSRRTENSNINTSKSFFINNNIVCPGGSAICIHKDILPEDAVVTHVITCQGRDHVVNVQSGRRNLVVVNVHFELELTLGRLRERLRLIAPHWPPYPNAVGIIMGDFNICEPEEGRFNVWNLTLTDGDAGKAALFHALFPHVLEIAQPDHTWRDSSVIGIIRTL